MATRRVPAGTDPQQTPPLAVVADNRELRAEVEITPGRPNRARLNGAPLSRPRELLGVLRVVVLAQGRRQGPLRCPQAEAKEKKVQQRFTQGRAHPGRQ